MENYRASEDSAENFAIMRGGSRGTKPTAHYPPSDTAILAKAAEHSERENPSERIPNTPEEKKF